MRLLVVLAILVACAGPAAARRMVTWRHRRPRVRRISRGGERAIGGELDGVRLLNPQKLLS
jgi:hypothetical protein